MQTSIYNFIQHTDFVLQTIKQLQQRLAELKRTLQKELVRQQVSYGLCLHAQQYSDL